jgi:hypothetical protein
VRRAKHRLRHGDNRYEERQRGHDRTFADDVKHRSVRDKSMLREAAADAQ